MRKQIGIDKDAPRFWVLDLDTGKQIKDCFMADEDKGKYGVWEEDCYGRFTPVYKTGNVKLIGPS